MNSSTSLSQHYLSAALNVLVQYVYQDNRDKNQWERIRRIILNELNTVMSEGVYSGYSPLFILVCSPEGRQLLMSDSILLGEITADGLNAVIAQEKHKGKSALYFLVSSPEGWSLLRDQQSLKDSIKLECLVSTFLHDNNDGTEQTYSALAHILEDENKHAVLFDNTRLMAEITMLVTSCLSPYESSSQTADDKSNGDYIIKLLLENTPERFIGILSSANITHDTFMTYLNEHNDLNYSFAEHNGDEYTLRTYTMFSDTDQSVDVPSSEQSIFEGDINTQQHLSLLEFSR